VLAAKARAKSVSIKFAIAPDLPLIPGNAGELNQVWSNLIDNALDAVGEAGHIIVSAARDRTNVVVRVIDDGSGIPPDVEGRIFDPFFTTKPMGQGTGLGLDITRGVVRSHGGQISVQSRPGHTEFLVILPIERAANG
jgi:signal transduction histidine kinase